MSKDLQVGKLSDIMPTEARIALPEVVSVFISKYETELYNNKADLSDEIIALKSEKELIEHTVVESADFSAYVGLKQTKLRIVSYQSGSVIIDWDEGTLTTTIGFHNLDSKGQAKTYSTNSFSKDFSIPLNKSFSKAYVKVKADLSEANVKLQHTVAQINDMARKERQVKARISEMRLEEQGLDSFLNDSAIQKLISTS
ncbi:MAG: hypothetical protein DRQ01_00890 [Ignavibacteriae bacterium]|nr:MAG: hypothetical protein DRQ01_00890 [Ignavibacteriota bacterium]